MAALAVATVLVATLVMIWVAGASPEAALRALVDGSVGSRFALGETLTRATGLVLTALAAVVALRAGVLNIGVEGQLLAGAAAAAAVGPALSGSPTLSRLAVVVASLLAGALATLPAHVLAERRRVPAVLSTILLNLVAAAAVTWLVRGPLRDPAGDFPQSQALSEETRLKPLVPGLRTTAAFPAALLLAPVVGLLLTRTRPGLRMRAAGDSPEAAVAAGLPAARLRATAFAISGALAGLAGGLEVLAVTGRLFDPFASGVGYAGLAAALLGGLTSSGAALSALFFAALGAGGSAMQRDAGVPAALALVVPALAVLAVLAARRREP